MHPALEDEEEIQVCTECQGFNQITLPDGSTQCGNCD